MNIRWKLLGDRRSLCRYSSRKLSGREVRRHFINFFLGRGHDFVKSSSVKPFNDPTLEFVNAGMNQFKNVFLGLSPPLTARATNSQKCIRIGGKHNDLLAVGHDSYHHTFFEMLGNWSFGDYFKEEACQSAWKLVTSAPFSLPKSQLYVTYFRGDESLSLPPDLETKEIWRKIGVPDERILPFGIKDNFWEMGMTGPCGPSTEIHFDHLGSKLRSECVNANLENLTELWNLVFIQYQRNEDGNLTQLKQSFVDTGMGLERLVALLQNKSSNYDTDLFTPLFQYIAKYSKKDEYGGKFGNDDTYGNDTYYRILADHSRMIAISLADNMFPDYSHSLRRVIRKTLAISDYFAPNSGVNLLIDLTKVVGDSLGDFYPEILQNSRQIEFILKDEYELWRDVRTQLKSNWDQLLKTDPLLGKLTDVQSVGLVAALKELEKLKIKKGECLEPSLALALFDRYGLNVQLIEEVASIKGYKLDRPRLNSDIIELKRINKAALHSSKLQGISKRTLESLSSRFEPTDETAKYSYVVNGKYRFEPIQATVLAVIHNDSVLEGSPIEPDERVGILLDKTNFWSHLKGDSDKGVIKLTDSEEVNVDNVVRWGDYILHFGTLNSKNSVNLIGSSVSLHIDTDHRFNLMRNTTASHILTKLLNKKFVADLQLFVNSKHNLTVTYCLYGENISEGECMLFEYLVNKEIQDGIKIDVASISSKDVVSGIAIPQILSLESSHFPLIKFSGENTKELSYGPNVLNTRDIIEFCFTSININKKKRKYTFTCLTGPNVDDAYKKTEELLNRLQKLNSESEMSLINKEITNAKDLINQNLVPMSRRIELNYIVSKLSAVIKKKSLEEQVNEVVRLVEQCKKDKQAVVHYTGEDCELEKLTKLCPDLPIMLFAYNRGSLSVRCCTPKESALEADAWMKEVTRQIGGVATALKGHDPKRVSTLKPVKMNRQTLDKVVGQLKELALSTAQETRI